MILSTFILFTTPKGSLMLLCSLLIQTLLFMLLLSMYQDLSWSIMLTILVIVGGVLVLIGYSCSLYPMSWGLNIKISFLVVSMFLIMIYYPSGIVMSIISEASNTSTVYSFKDSGIYVLLIWMGLYLLMALISVVKVLNVSKGALREV